MEIVIKNLSKIFKGDAKKGIDDTKAVDNISIHIKNNELVGLLGPSGCGKSTTLYMIAGLKEPSNGEIWFDNEDVTNLASEKRGIGFVFQNYALYPHMNVYKNIAFPLTNLKIDTYKKEYKIEMLTKENEILTNYEELVNIIKDSSLNNKISKERAIVFIIDKYIISPSFAKRLFNHKLFCVSSKEELKNKVDNIINENNIKIKEIKDKYLKRNLKIDDSFYITNLNDEKIIQRRKLVNDEIDLMVREVARLVQIEEQLDKKPKELSGGQQQRVAIARALVKKPRVLLLDEPLSNLDARLRIKTREEIKRIQKETGITTVFVTHDQEEAMSICDEIVVMNNGKVMQEGKPIEIYKNPSNLFVAKFLGTPPINVFKGIIKEDGIYVDNEKISSLKNENYINKEVYVGIRPEGFIFVSSKKDENNLDTISLRVKEITLNGKDTTLTLEHDSFIGENIKIVVDSDLNINIDTYQFKIKTNKMFVFDIDSEERIDIK